MLTYYYFSVNVNLQLFLQCKESLQSWNIADSVNDEWLEIQNHLTLQS